MENEELENKAKERKIPFFIPYAMFIKHITEKSGLGDADDFKKRINAINKFYDNVEIGNNIQSLGAKAKGESIKKGNKLFLPKGLTKEEGIKYWNDMSDNFGDVLKSLELKNMDESELLNAMKEKGFTPSTNREASNLLQKESSDAINNFNKIGQKAPFKGFNSNKPRGSVAKATKKFNLLKNTLDILSNPKLNAVIGLFLTPTPLYEPSVEEIKKKNNVPMEPIKKGETE